MAAENPVATTWTFTLRLADQKYPQPQLDAPSAMTTDPHLLLITWHLEHNTLDDSLFVRGIVRCVKPRSKKQMLANLPEGNFKPLRGVFTVQRIAETLRPSRRIGELRQIGDPTKSPYKRPLPDHCLDTCICCFQNKAPRVD